MDVLSKTPPAPVRARARPGPICDRGLHLAASAVASASCSYDNQSSDILTRVAGEVANGGSSVLQSTRPQP
ncbi:hypothetical protein AAFF_G00161010 [Aldrovandia affinis]|uniref:Uncharacterized protein n=1 Tax=Aldrovandia affinis TaxID=143900 RepID=A0AAD7RMV7_9TELE|nr:hypothetical protein AAFF_G00161010 [Aldrovandia affinis]